MVKYKLDLRFKRARPSIASESTRGQAKELHRLSWGLYTWGQKGVEGSGRGWVGTERNAMELYRR